MQALLLGLDGAFVVFHARSYEQTLINYWKRACKKARNYLTRFPVPCRQGATHSVDCCGLKSPLETKLIIYLRKESLLEKDIFSVSDTGSSKEKMLVIPTGVEPNTIWLQVQILCHQATGDLWELRPLNKVHVTNILHTARTDIQAQNSPSHLHPCA